MDQMRGTHCIEMENVKNFTRAVRVVAVQAGLAEMSLHLEASWSWSTLELG